MGPSPLCSWAGFSGGSICPSPGSCVRLPPPAGSPEALPKPAGSETSSSRRVPPAAPPPAAAAAAAPLGPASYTAGATVARLTPQAESGPRTDGLAPPLAGPVAGGGPDAAGCCGLLFFSSWWWLSNRRQGGLAGGTALELAAGSAGLFFGCRLDGGGSCGFLAWGGGGEPGSAPAAAGCVTFPDRGVVLLTGGALKCSFFLFLPHNRSCRRAGGGGEVESSR